MQPFGHNRYGPKMGDLPLWGGELGPHLIQRGVAEAYLHVKFHVDPLNRLATVQQRYRQNRQWSDSVGQTVLQMVTQKRLALCYRTAVCLSVLFVCLFVYLSVTLLYCVQMVGWIKMKLDMQVGLGPGHVVLDGDPAPPPPKGQIPQF